MLRRAPSRRKAPFLCIWMHEKAGPARWQALLHVLGLECRLLVSLDGGIERGAIEDVLDRLSADERKCQELVHSVHEIGAVDVVPLLVALAGVLRAPCFVVHVCQVVDLAIDLHVDGVMAVEVVSQLIVIDIECLGCSLSHGMSFRRRARPNVLALTIPFLEQTHTSAWASDGNSALTD